MNDYDKHLYRILALAGHKGLQTKKLALHVFNATNSLFESANFDEVYKYVQLFVRRNSSNKKRIIVHAARHGCYRLNMRSPYTREILDALNPSAE